MTRAHISTDAHCIVFSGPNGKPPAQPGWAPPRGNVWVFAASLRARDPVQKGELPIFRKANFTFAYSFPVVCLLFDHVQANRRLQRDCSPPAGFRLKRLFNSWLPPPFVPLQRWDTLRIAITVTGNGENVILRHAVVRDGFMASAGG